MRYKGEIFRICEQMTTREAMTPDNANFVIEYIQEILNKQGKEITFDEVAEGVLSYLRTQLGVLVEKEILKKEEPEEKKYMFLVAYKSWLELSWDKKEYEQVDSMYVTFKKDHFTCKDITDLELDIRHQLWENTYKTYYKDGIETNLQVKILSVTKLEESEED